MKLFILLLMISFLGLSFCLFRKHEEYSLAQVTALVFSGNDNPTWTLDQYQNKILKDLVKEQRYVNPIYSSPFLGYSGFVVRNRDEQLHILGNMLIEIYILSTAPENTLSEKVNDHIRKRITQVNQKLNSHPYELTLSQAIPSENIISNVDCSYVVGPDVGFPNYDPMNDDLGCFVSDQESNNCYNYATDVATGTFAQPGRGSGRKFEADSCPSLIAASENDGLTYVGFNLPIIPPEEGHFVALLVWENSGFHWLRLDSNYLWSHKPGSTPIKNTDNEGDIILHPEIGDFSPWDTFCGYMHVIPSEIQIA